MHKSAGKVDNLINSLIAGEDVKEVYRKKARLLDSECGCSMGAKFTGIAMLLCLVNIFFPLAGHGHHWLVQVCDNLLFVFICAICGKLLGLALAQVEFWVLIAKLEKLNSTSNGEMH